MLAKIRALFATISIIVFMPFIILQIYCSRDKENGRRARRQCRFFFKLNGLKVERIGEYDSSANLLMLNHQSVTDIIFFEAYHPANLCWVAKKQLGEIPLYGHALKGSDMILIDREDKNGIVFLLKEAKRQLAQNRLIAIFPEGTRSRGEEKFLPFKPGAKILASKFKLKIQPAVLINTRKLYNSSPMSVDTNTARVVLLDAFIPDYNDDKWYEKIEAMMQETYLKHYKELNQEALSK